MAAKSKSKAAPKKTPAKKPKKSFEDLIDAWEAADSDFRTADTMRDVSRTQREVASKDLADRIFGKRTKAEDRRVACVECGGEYYLVERQSFCGGDDDCLLSVERVEFVKA